MSGPDPHDVGGFAPEADLRDDLGTVGPQPGEDLGPEPAPQQGPAIAWSYAAPSILARAIFGTESVVRPDGQPMSPDEQAGAYVATIAPILQMFGFDESVEMLGVGQFMKPGVVVGVGIAAMVGLALLMRPKRPDPEEVEEVTA